MMNKKGGTLAGVFSSLLLIMALSFGLSGYISYNYESANITEQIGYNESNTKLQLAEDNLNNKIEEIKNSTSKISAADSNVALVAWNGLVGIGQTIILFIGLIDISQSVWSALVPGLSFLPDWVQLLIEMGVVIWIILIIIGALKGESKT